MRLADDDWVASVDVFSVEDRDAAELDDQ
jgi:hypothetical protein